MPLDTLLPHDTHPYISYAHDAIARADVARRLARSHLAISQVIQKNRYDERHRVVHFSPGGVPRLTVSDSSRGTL